MAADREAHALLVGIDRYSNLSPGLQLDGCVNDARLMAGLLRDRFAFPETNVTVLEDEKATRDGILAALEDLLRRVREDDAVVVFYSGHGSRMRDREGDKPDGWDQTLVPADSGRDPYPNRDVTDDEVYSWLLRLSATTPYVTLIFDSCYSGSIARAPSTAKARWLEPDPRPAEQLPPSPVAALRGRRPKPGPSGWLPVSDRYVLLAACHADELSFEIKVEETALSHGAFAYFLSRELMEAGGETTYRDVFERCRDKVTALFERQHPQLEGACDRVLFGARELVPMRFLPVRERAGDRILLGGGAAHGVTAESWWTLYPPATKRVSETTTALGLAVIRAVGAVTAQAEIVEESETGAVATGSRAVEHGAADRVLADLETRARYLNALSLENPDPESRLRNRVDMVLKRRVAGRWEVAEPGEDGAETVFAEGERVAIEITNHHEDPVYVAVFDFGVSGSVSLIHPVAGAAEALPAGRPLTIGERPGEELVLVIPEGFPLGGTVHQKLFATTRETDFSFLAQEGSSGWERRRTSLVEELLATAWTGHGEQSASVRRSPGEDWTTVTRSFLLRPKDDSDKELRR